MPHLPARHPRARTAVLAAVLVVLGTLGLIGISRMADAPLPGGPAGSSLQVERPIGHVALSVLHAGKRPVVAHERAPGEAGQPAVPTVAAALAAPRCTGAAAADPQATAPGRESAHGAWCGRAPPVDAV